MKEIIGKANILIGTNKASNEKIYLTKPTWDCGWYWSFGYLGNKHTHYHLNSQCNKNINMHDAILADYFLTDTIQKDLWEFCELSSSIYALKDYAKFIGRGGSYYTANPMEDILLDKEYATKINDEILPKVIQAFWDKFSK